MTDTMRVEADHPPVRRLERAEIEAAYEKHGGVTPAFFEELYLAKGLTPPFARYDDDPRKLRYDNELMCFLFDRYVDEHKTISNVTRTIAALGGPFPLSETAKAQLAQPVMARLFG